MRAERARRTWTRQHLARRLGWAPVRVLNLESEREPVGADELLQLCEAFGVTLGQLACGAEPQTLATLGLAPGLPVR